VPNSPENVRNECYGRLLQAVRLRAERYYTAHPEYLDERADQGLNEASHMLAEMLNILDEYEIARPVVK
jgi:hypothetical protein